MFRAGILFLFACLVGCSLETEPLPLGLWRGDPEAAKVAVEFVEAEYGKPAVEKLLGKDHPSTVEKIVAEFRKDQTCELSHLGNAYQGTWTFDKAENLVELTMTRTKGTANSPPANLPESQRFICVVNPQERTMDLYLGDRKSYDLVKKVRAVQYVPAMVVLKRE